MNLKIQSFSGLMPYDETQNKMEDLAKKIAEGLEPEQIWLLEHENVFTLGTSAKEEDVYDKENFKIFTSGRGGKVTYHGPGQRIIYVMLNLKKRMKEIDIRKFVKELENWVISTLKDFNIIGEIREGRIGIWVKTPGKNFPHEEAKIGAIGIRVKKHVTFHGIAVNINPKLDNFKKINPCGLEEFGVTSFDDLNIRINMQEFDEKLIKNLPLFLGNLEME